jgi:uncharacterized protein (UPF0305 family)
MQRAIKHYIKKRARNINNAEHLGESFINQFFDLIDDEINQVRRVEIKKAREKKLEEWRKIEKLNYGHNNKNLGRLRR